MGKPREPLRGAVDDLLYWYRIDGMPAVGRAIARLKARGLTDTEIRRELVIHIVKIDHPTERENLFLEIDRLLVKGR